MIGSVDIYFHGSPFVVFFLSVASSFKKMADNAHAYFWKKKKKTGSEPKLLTLNTLQSFCCLSPFYAFYAS